MEAVHFPSTLPPLSFETLKGSSQSEAAKLSGKVERLKVEWKQSGGYKNIFHFYNHHNSSLLPFDFTRIVEAGAISIDFFDKQRNRNGLCQRKHPAQRVA